MLKDKLSIHGIGIKVGGIMIPIIRFANVIIIIILETDYSLRRDMNIASLVCKRLLYTHEYRLYHNPTSNAYEFVETKMLVCARVNAHVMTYSGNRLRARVCGVKYNRVVQ